MIIRSIELTNFRNFSHKKIEFGDAINVIFGLNGQGKTSILEAISVTCLSKSFRTRNDGNLVQHDKDHFQIVSQIVLDNTVEKQIKVEYGKSNGKIIEINHSRIKSILDLFGSFPVVILSPEDDILTIGPPQERRRFLNFILAQIDREYLKLIQDYDRIIKQRNKILQGAKESRYRFMQKIEPWDEKLFETARAITAKRAKFLPEFEQLVLPIHQELTIMLEKVSLKYLPSFDLNWQEYGQFQQVLEQIRNEEIVKGVTLIGPHRDNILFLLNGYDVRKYGSRGQHRSLLLALKIAIYKLILTKKKETPAFLLDDVYSEIDDIREKAFNDYFLDLKQIFITTHEKDSQFDLPVDFHKEIRYIPVENSNVTKNDFTLR